MSPRVYMVTLTIGETHLSERVTHEFVKSGPLHMLFEHMDDHMYKYLGYLPRDRQWEGAVWE